MVGRRQGYLATTVLAASPGRRALAGAARTIGALLCARRSRDRITIALIEWGDRHDLRIARLQLPAWAAARVAQALRDRDPQDLGEAWHQAGRVLDRADRRWQPRSLLSVGLGLHGGARKEVDDLSGRSGVDRGAQRERARRPDPHQRQEHAAAANRLFGGEIGRRGAAGWAGVSPAGPP